MVDGPAIYDSAAQFPDRYQRHKQDLALGRICQRRGYTAIVDGNLHVPGGAISNADRDPDRYSDSNSHSDRNANCYSNSYAYADSHANGDSDGYAYTDTYAYVDAYGPAEIKPDTKAATDPAAAALACSGIWKR